jgi:hypothetical protein
LTRKAQIATGIIGLGLVMLVVATIANKRWWIRRIRARWVMQRYIWDEVLRRWTPEVSDYQENKPERYKLADLINTYWNGDEGWYRVGEEMPPPPEFAYGQGPLGVGIVTNPGA